MREREITMNGLAIPGLTSGVTQVGDVSLHHWSGGDPDGTPVLLWHGFVETSYGWRVVAPILVEAGCSVLIPDMRGYGDSDKPEGTAGYDARSLANEFRGLVAATGFGGSRPLVIAAHDMGAPPALIWAADHPQEVQTLVYIDEPVMLGEVIRGLITYQPQQANRFGSLWWWTLPFAPGAAEKIIVGNERGWLEWFYEFGHSNPPGEVIDEYLRTFSGREGVRRARRLSCRLHDYRANRAACEKQGPGASDGGRRRPGPWRSCRANAWPGSNRCHASGDRGVRAFRARRPAGTARQHHPRRDQTNCRSHLIESAQLCHRAPNFAAFASNLYGGLIDRRRLPAPERGLRFIAKRIGVGHKFEDRAEGSANKGNPASRAGLIAPEQPRLIEENLAAGQARALKRALEIIDVECEMLPAKIAGEGRPLLVTRLIFENFDAGAGADFIHPDGAEPCAAG
jgi:pimeloyl-ACP methyl ester carboxylesterase